MAVLAGAAAPSAQTPGPPPAGDKSLRPHDMPSHWLASGFAGADFGGQADGSSFDFGGQLGYLFHGIIGGEFVGDFSPNFNMKSVVLVERPDVNAYTFNAIAAMPMGRDWRLQPYVAGGIGAIQMRSTVFTSSSVPG